MKSVTTGWGRAEVGQKQIQRRRVEQAIGRALEALENRVMMSAGQLDWSFYDSNGQVTGSYGYLNDVSDDATSTYDMFDVKSINTKAGDIARLSETVDVTTGIDNRIIKVLVDNAGKLIVIGVNVGRTGYVSTWTEKDVPYIDASGKLALRDEKRYYYGTIKHDDLFIARYNPDGSLDMVTGTNSSISPSRGDYYGFEAGLGLYSFGDLGAFDYNQRKDVPAARQKLSDAIAKQFPAQLDDTPITAAIDPTDNSIVVIGTGSNGYYMARYNAATLTATMTALTVDGPGTVTDMRMLADGSFILVGNSLPWVEVNRGQWAFAARYSRTGTLMNQFVVPDFKFYSADGFTGVDADAQGRIYVIGYTDDRTWNPDGGYSHLVVQRYSSTGVIDSAFGYQLNAELEDFGQKNVTGIDVKVMPDGRTVVMGQLDAVADAYHTLDTTVVARFNSNGTLDSTFIGGGRAYIRPTLGGTWLGREVVLQSDGGIVVSGIRDGSELELVRLNQTGRVDTTYGTNGFAQLAPQSDIGSEIAYDPWFPSIAVNRGPSGAGNDKIIVGVATSQQAAPHQATGGGSSLIEQGAQWLDGQWTGYYVRITGGTGFGVLGSDALQVVGMAQSDPFSSYYDTLVFGGDIGFTPDATTTYEFYLPGTGAKFLVDTNATGWTANQFTDALIRISAGTGAGQIIRVIGMAQSDPISGNWDTLILPGNINFTPDSTTVYQLFNPKSTDEATATGGSNGVAAPATLIDTTQNWGVNSLAGRVVFITAGTGAGSSFTIASNTKTVLSAAAGTDIGFVPDATTQYVILMAPPATATGGSNGNTIATAPTLIDATQNWTTNLAGKVVHITAGTGAGNSFTIVSNTTTVLTIGAPGADLGFTPDATTKYEILEQAPATATGGANGAAAVAPTLTDSTQNWTTSLAGRTILITGGTGVGSSFVIVSNTTTVLTLGLPGTDLGFTPDATTKYVIYDASAESTATSGTNGATVAPSLTDSTASWTVDQWKGAVVEITSGPDDGEVYAITGNTADTLLLGAPGDTIGFSGGTPSYFIYFPSPESGTATGGANGTAAQPAGQPFIEDSTQTWTADQWKGGWVQITDGTGAGNGFVILSNTGTQLYIGAAGTDLGFTPDATTKYKLYSKAITSTATGGADGTAVTAPTLTDTTKTWLVDQWKDGVVQIIAGAGIGKSFVIQGNTADTLTLGAIGDTIGFTPDATTVYVIYPVATAVASATGGANGTASQPATPPSVTDTGATWVVDQWKNAWVKLTQGATSGVFQIVSNTADTLILGAPGDVLSITPDATTDYVLYTSIYIATATSGTDGSISSASLTDTTQNWITDLTGKVVLITGGTGAGSYFTIKSNTTTTLVLGDPGVDIGFTPDATTTYVILDTAESTATAGANGAPATPAQIQDSAQNWTGDLTGLTVIITAGTGAGSFFTIKSNTTTSLVIGDPGVDIGFTPDATTQYIILYSAAATATGGANGTSVSTPPTLVDVTQNWTTNLAGSTVVITGGTGAGSSFVVVSNTTNTLVLGAPGTDIGFTPDATTQYVIQIGAASTATGGTNDASIAPTLINTGANWKPNQYTGALVYITAGAGAGKYLYVVGMADSDNTKAGWDTLILGAPGTDIGFKPDSTTKYIVYAGLATGTATSGGTSLAGAATGGGAVLTDTSAMWPDAYSMVGKTITITSGTGAGSSLVVTSVAKSSPDLPWYDRLVFTSIDFVPDWTTQYQVEGEMTDATVVERVLTTNQAPTAATQAPDVYEPTVTYTFEVTYTDDELVQLLPLWNSGAGLNIYGPSGLLGATIDVIDVTQMNTNPYGANPEVARDSGGTLWGAKSYTVTYAVELFLDDSAHNGLYTITLDSNTIFDANTTTTQTPAPRAALSRTLGTFLVNIADLDVTPPDVSFDYVNGHGADTNDMQTGMTVMGKAYWDFHVVYSDDSAVDISTLGDGDLLVTGPRGYSQPVTIVGAPEVLADGSVLVTYRILAPNATAANDYAHPWDPTFNGLYQVNAVEQQVADTAGNFLGEGPLSQFSVSLRSSQTAYPSATLSPIAPVVTGTDYVVFTVTFTSSQYIPDALMDAASIAGNNGAISVTNTATGVSALATYVPGSLSPAGVGNSQIFTAQYKIANAGADWNTAGNGVYSVRVVGGQVRDTDTVPNYIPAQQIGTFVVSITPYVSGTVSSPVALTPTVDVTVHFLNGFVPNSLSADDLTITGTVNGKEVTLYPAADPVMQGTTSALYSFYAPSGIWDSSANGDYTVVLNGGMLTNGVVTLGQQTLALFTFSYQVPVVIDSNLPLITAPTDATWDLTVVYSDASGLDQTSFGVDDILARRVDNNTHAGLVCESFDVTLANNGTQATVVYHFAAPGGYWDWTDNGFYVFSLDANQVFNTSGDAASEQELWKNPLDLAQDLEAPKATATLVQNIHLGVLSYSFQVDMTDNVAVDFDTMLDGPDFVVTSPSGRKFYASLTAAEPNAKTGPKINATYTFTIYDDKQPLSDDNAPLTAADTGLWTISSIAGAFADVSGNGCAALQVATFRVLESNPPTYVVNCPATVTTAATTYDFTITYSDETGVLRSTIDDNDVQIQAPNGMLYPVTLVSVDKAVDSKVLVASYSFAVPGTGWTPAMNGHYAIVVNGGEVTDVSGNGIAASNNNGFDVALDTTGPTAVATSPTGSSTLPAITSATSAVYTFKVRFQDPQGVDQATITAASIVVGDDADVLYPVTLVSVDPVTDPTNVTATFSMTAPGLNGWTAALNGSFWIKLVAGGVTDSLGNPSAAADIGNFSVSIVAAPVRASLTATPTVVAGASTMRFTVRFTSTDVIDYTTLETDNILRVTGPNGYDEPAYFVAIDSDTNGAARVVTYSIDAPGVWDYTDNGSYRISVVPGNGVQTLAGGTLAASPIATFRVNVSRVSLIGRIISVYGTGLADTIEVIRDGTNLRVLFNNTAKNYLIDRVGGILIYGGAGNDAIKVQTTLGIPATIYGEAGRDTIQGGAAGDSIDGGDGPDFIRGWGGNDSIFGGAGNDTIYGGAGNDSIDGGIGDDRLYGEAGNDTLIGGSGNDLLSGGAGTNSLLQ